MLPSQRALFDIPEEVAYFNCAYMAPLPRPVRRAGEVAVARKSQPWTLGSDDFFDELEHLRALAGRLIGATPEDIAFVPSVSYGAALAAQNLRVRAGDDILVLEEQFPSNVYAWQELASRAAATLRIVPRPADHDWTRALCASVSERTAFAALPHCHWVDGHLLDLERVAEALRSVGAGLVIDATQSLGALPLDVERIRPDFVLAATYKWLLGPYGMTLLYASPAHHEGRPLEHNWMAREGAEDFRRLSEYRSGFREGARRFDMGEAANFILMPMVAEALKLLLEWNPAAIQATLRAKTERLAHACEALGLLPLPAEQRAGHLLGLRAPKGLPGGLAESLRAAGVHVSVRGDCIRISPHLYNDAGDEARLLAALEALCSP